MFGGMLPTLDLQIWVRPDNKVLFKYFEKTMTPITVLHARSAIPESTRRATLNQELIRRLTNTSELVEEEERVEIVDAYARKLINSEYSLKMTREFLVGGLKGYERLLSLSRDKSNPRWKPLHMSASWNGKNRRIAKQLAKTNWYKGKTLVDPPASNHQAENKNNNKTTNNSDNITTNQEEDSQNPSTPMQGACRKGKGDLTRTGKAKKRRGIKRENITLGGLKRIEKATKRKEKQKVNKKMGSLGLPTSKKSRRKPPVTIGVCFLDNTAGGILVKRMQEGESTIGDKTDVRVRMTEAAGTPLGVLLTSNNPWGTKDCERDDCVTCAQGDENLIDCKKRNILYESACTVCNPVDEKKGKKNEISFLKAGKAIYVGESSRSLYERTKEHMSDRNGWKEESHQVKHWITDHPELQEPPRFRFKLVRSFKDPMSRQLSEAVRIELRGSNILNSKSEFTRCRVPRLRVDLEGWKKENMKPFIQNEDIRIYEDEISLQESESKKRKFAAEEGKPLRKKQKRIRLEKLEGWGEQNDNYEEEPLPEGWRVSLNQKDISIEETGFIVNPEKEKKQANIPEGWMKDKTIKIIMTLPTKQTQIFQNL